MSGHPTPKLLSPSQSQRLRECFEQSGFTAGATQAAMREWSPPGVGSQTKSLLLDERGSPSALTTLIRLFELNVVVPLADAQTALPGEVLKACLDSGLTKRDGKNLVPGFRVQPVRGKLLVSDRPSAMQVKSALVIGEGAVGIHMLDITPRTAAGKALDVCAGGGIQTLFLAEHCEKVTAIDLNPRAIEFARFNARLNGLRNVEFLPGNRLEPVQDRTFNLIICNPPFYIGPTRRILYSDNEMELDQFCREILRKCAGHLEEAGQLHALLEWVEVEGQPWKERLAEWFGDLGCDVWVRRDYHYDTLSYSRRRLAENPPASRDTLSEWADYFHAAGVKQVHGGSVAMRRRDAKNWLFFDDFDKKIGQSFGESVPDGFVARDFLAAHPSDESLLRARLVVSDKAWVEEHSHAKDGRWSTDVVRVRLEGGAEYSGKANKAVAELLRHLDGARTLREAILASKGLADQAAVPQAARYADIARRLICRGVLLLARASLA